MASILPIANPSEVVSQAERYARAVTLYEIAFRKLKADLVAPGFAMHKERHRRWRRIAVIRNNEHRKLLQLVYGGYV